MNLLTFLHKPKTSTNSTWCNTESACESQIKNNLFPPDQYTREEENSHSLLKFKDQATGKSFYLEIKTCTCDWMHQIQWCTEMQLRKYLMCHKKTPTFLLLDVQNDDHKSHTFYLLSMTQACHAHLVDTSIMHCKIATDEPVTSKQLWSR
jgi:hypothetical protein